MTFNLLGPIRSTSPRFYGRVSERNKSVDVLEREEELSHICLIVQRYFPCLRPISSMTRRWSGFLAICFCPSVFLFVLSIVFYIHGLLWLLYLLSCTVSPGVTGLGEGTYLML